MLLFLLRLYRIQCKLPAFEWLPQIVPWSIPFAMPYMNPMIHAVSHFTPFHSNPYHVPTLTGKGNETYVNRGGPAIQHTGGKPCKHKICMGRHGGRGGVTLDPIYDELTLIGGKPFLGGANNDGQYPTIDYRRLGKSTQSILPQFLNRVSLYSTYNEILIEIGSPMRGGGNIGEKGYPVNFPKIVGYPLNKYDEFIKNINGNKHHIYKVKKAIDLYMGIAKRHNINIPFESEIYSLLKSINATYNTYTKNILDLQKTSVVTPKEGTLEIDVNDLKYESNYSSKIKHNVNKLNNSKKLFVNQLQTLFSIEEQLHHIVKHDLVKHYAI